MNDTVFADFPAARSERVHEGRSDSMVGPVHFPARGGGPKDARHARPPSMPSELSAQRALCLTWKTPLQVDVVEFPRQPAACSPEGIRTPDLFLEREAPWTTRRPGRHSRIRARHAWRGPFPRAWLRTSLHQLPG